MKLTSTSEFAELDKRLLESDAAAEATLARLLDVDARLARVKRDARSAGLNNVDRCSIEPAE
ncbi:MAG TPA: hypothetical protein VFC19_30420 [Candidatus Limnocylindrales bacterium]|nr:hypothetical protein [Candidatus Limnocylindrales bacterium]HZO68822.1 hypothetical protein [Kribbellaceae bacterium]